MTSDEIEQGAREQAMRIAGGLMEQDHQIEPGKEIVALIAYLQKLGTYMEVDAGEAVPEEAAGVIKPSLPDETREAVTTAEL